MCWLLDKLISLFPPQDKYGATVRCFLYILIWQLPIIIFVMGEDRIEKILLLLRTMALKVVAVIVVMFLPPYVFAMMVNPIGNWWSQFLDFSCKNLLCNVFIWIGVITYEILVVGYWLLWRRYTRNYNTKVYSEALIDKLYHDAPITSQEEDRFNREPFVHALVDSIVRDSNREDAEYIGVFGDWGSGKTSVMNLVRQKFSTKDAVCKGADPIFVDINPWMFRNSDDAIGSFLRKLVHTLDKKGVKKAAVAFSAYNRVISLRRVEVKGGIVGESLETLRQCFFAFIYDEDKVIDRVKKSLLDMGRRLVIVIDDLERLPSKDVCKVISFMKANFDFPNVVVIFLSDRKYLARAVASLINRNDNEDIEALGLSYLSKIIQKQHNLPELSSDVLISFFKEGLKEILLEDELFGYDIESDDGLEFETVRHYVNTVRDVKILLSKLWSEISLQRNSTRSGTLTLHVGDLVALTVLRIWSNDVYKDLKYLIEKLHGGSSGKDLSLVFGMKLEEIDSWIQDREKNNEYRPFIREFLEKRVGLRRGEDSENNVRYRLSHANNPEVRFTCRLASFDYYKMYFEDFKELSFINKETLNEFLLSICNNVVPERLLEDSIKDKSLPLLLRTLEGVTEVSIGKEIGTYFRTLIWLSNRPFSEEFVILSKGGSIACVYPNIYDVYLAIGRCIKLYIERCKQNREYIGTRRSSFTIFREDATEILAKELLDSPSVYLLWQCISWDDKRHGNVNAIYDGQIFSHSRFKQLLICYINEVEKMQKEDRLFSSNVFFDLFRAWNMVLDMVNDDQKRLNMQLLIKDSFRSVSNIKKISPFLVRSPVKFGDGEMIDKVPFYGIDSAYVEKHFGVEVLHVIIGTLEKQKRLSLELTFLLYALNFVVQNEFDKDKCQFEKQYDYVRAQLDYKKGS